MIYPCTTNSSSKVLPCKFLSSGPLNKQPGNQEICVAWFLTDEFIQGGNTVHRNTLGPGSVLE